MKFVAIDFETGNYKRYSACGVGIVVVDNGIIVDEYETLIRPPDNNIIPKFSEIHNIFPNDTKNYEEFPYYFETEIANILSGQFVIAHNQGFDRSVLKATMEYYEYDYNLLNLQNPDKWDCTMKIYKHEKKCLSGALKYLCEDYKIELKHHNVLSDARACANLYYKHLMNDFNVFIK